MNCGYKRAFLSAPEMKGARIIFSSACGCESCLMLLIDEGAREMREARKESDRLHRPGAKLMNARVYVPRGKEGFDYCSTCGAEFEEDCPQSQRDCGHHCNCSWTHDVCHWCGKVWEGE